MFDKFTALLRVEKFDFEFTPTRYEVWMNQKIAMQGSVDIKILGKVISPNDKVKVEITNLSKLSDEITSSILFDDLVSQKDRLQLLTIPKFTATDCNGLVAVRTVFGSTIESMNFKRNEPYCCSLFFKNSELNMITFSFSNPVKLIEFYCD